MRRFWPTGYIKHNNPIYFIKLIFTRDYSSSNKIKIGCLPGHVIGLACKHADYIRISAPKTVLENVKDRVRKKMKQTYRRVSHNIIIIFLFTANYSVCRFVRDTIGMARVQCDSLLY